MVVPIASRSSAGSSSVTVAATVVVGLAATVAALGAGWPPEGLLGLAALELVVAGVFLAAGWTAHVRRPGNRTGPLLAVCGAAWALSALPWTAGGAQLPAWALALVWPAQNLWAAVLVHLVLAFPSGRLQGRPPRAVAAAAYAVAVTTSALTFGPPALLAGRRLGEEAWTSVANLAGAVLAAGVVVLLLLRRRRATAVERRALGPVLWAGAAVAATVAADAVLTVATRVPARDDVTDVLVLVGVATVPSGFLVGLLRSRLDRAGVADAAAALAALEGVPGAGDLRRVLAEALRDPTLDLAYRLAGDGHEAEGPDVDEHGRAVALPPPGSGRATTPVRHGDERIGTLVHDPALDPEAVAAAAWLARLAMANERRHAELRARVVQVTTSRERLAAAVEAERRRIERDLHDGVQQRLLAIGVLLTRTGLAAGAGMRAELLADARSELTAALADLRALGQGLRPAVLTERGLPGALAEVTWTAPLPVSLSWRGPREPRLPASVETTAYFVAAEAVANTVKHAGAGSARIHVDRGETEVTVTVTDDGRGGARPPAGAGGSGLRGIADRVAAAGGRLRVDSPEGGGTAVRVSLPCS